MNIAVLGAALETGNLGVSALAVSILEGIFNNQPDANITLFDYKHGKNRKESLMIDNEKFSYSRMGMILSKRLWQHENLYNILFSSKCSISVNPILQTLKSTDIAMDITGGDSFTDLYGSKVFKSGVIRKQLLIDNSIPFILLPQTYGPFTKSENFNIARKIICAAKMVWARDELSFDKLKKLLGNKFDPNKHKQGVDVAFLLSPIKPADGLPSIVQKWIDMGNEVVGVNINGLVFNHHDSKRMFGHKADYVEVVKEVIRKVVLDGKVKVVLISHVIAPPGNYESDRVANMKVFSSLPQSVTNSVFILPELYDQSQVKWVISRLDWFCGTRMHSTIASLSSGVPTATIAYSLKAQGVFASCNQEINVADLRHHTYNEILDIIWNSFISRRFIKPKLIKDVKSVKEIAISQMKNICDWS